MANVCIRCGKERIIIKEWNEKIESEIRVSTIMHIQTACPDPECQKAVDKSLAAQKQKDDERKLERVNQEKAVQAERERQKEMALQAPVKKRR